MAPKPANCLLFVGYIPCTPVSPDVLAHEIKDYPDKAEIDFLIKGFKFGFDLGCERRPPPRAPPRNGVGARENPTTTRELIYKEVALGRMPGPYSAPALPNMVFSPVNLVPKAGNPGKFRLIHNLAFPYDENAVNQCIPDAAAKVKYASFDEFVTMCLLHGKGAWQCKLDLDAAFRQCPMSLGDLPLLGFSIHDLYFINSNMAFGAHSSCQIFERFATVLNWRLRRVSPPNTSTHYLDDFGMVHLLHWVAEWLLRKLQEICATIGFPVQPSKCEGPTQTMEFLGMGTDSLLQRVTIPAAKIRKILNLIEQVLELACQRKRVKVYTIQRVTGMLQFVAKATPAGRPFIRHLYDLQGSLPKSFSLRLSAGAKADLHMWIQFLQGGDEGGRTLPFLNFLRVPNHRIQIHSDAAGNPNLVFGAQFGGRWLYGAWPIGFFTSENKPSITFLELFAVVLAVDSWGEQLKGERVHIKTDNEAVAHLLQTKSTPNEPIMRLLRHVTLKCLNFQMLLTAEHLPGVKNRGPDLLSRLKISQFKREFRFADQKPDPVRSPLWPPYSTLWDGQTRQSSKRSTASKSSAELWSSTSAGP